MMAWLPKGPVSIASRPFWLRQHQHHHEATLTDVAYSLGFENPTHFIRIFKQQYGISPSIL